MCGQWSRRGTQKEKDDFFLKKIIFDQWKRRKTEEENILRRKIF